MFEEYTSMTIIMLRIYWPILQMHRSRADAEEFQ
jgi:hypothetical protein